MPFVLEHSVVSRQLAIERHETSAGVRFTVDAQGSFNVLHQGQLIRDVKASVRHSMRMEIPDIDLPDLPPTIDGVPTHEPGHDRIPNPLHNGVVVTIEGIPSDFRIFDPDGQPFGRDEVTIADLKRFRDERGESRPWSYTLRGESKTYVLHDELNEAVGEPEGAINLTIRETVASTSAPPLVPRTPLDGSRQLITFDLYRVGAFVARASTRLPFGDWQGSMRLIDPDGGVAGSTSSDFLRCSIPLTALGKSRDAAGNPRLWTLEVSPQGGLGGGHVTATVRGEGRLQTSVLHDRIQRIFGTDGTFVKIAGADNAGYAEVHLTINDVTAAETIDMHGLLDARLKEQGEPIDIVPFEPRRIYRRSSDLGYAARVDASGIATTSIFVTVGPAQHLDPGTPALRLRVGVEGEVKVKWGPLTLATATAKGGGPLEAEVGMRIDDDGTPRLVSWLPDELFDIDIHAGAIAAFVAAAAAAAAAVGGPIGAIGGIIGGSVTAAIVEEAIEEYLNDTVAEGAKGMFDDPTLAPRILMTLLGTHLTYLPVRFDGDDILFEHLAPLEPEPRPRESYAGAIGRTIIEVAAGHTMFKPRTLGDTWAADNLKEKIKRVVVVMMENRSYDHVLGYRSVAPTDPRDEADGWTPDLIAAVNARAEQFRPPPPPPPSPGGEEIHYDQEPAVGPMRNSAFELNRLKLRTRLPKGVGHEVADVAQQLSEQMDANGRRINDPSGFINNFREHRLGNNPYGDQETKVVPFDVLRYYEKNPSIDDPNTGEPVDDLPMYSFLAENYGYCDRFFCSHPGPTLPNRMYSLAGDVQYDRYGFPILDNNHGDNFLLSRAQTIYDVLTRHGVNWRVYESVPSVTMLRMFARYASDDENIRPLEEFIADAEAGVLPSFVVVEPAMHHHPEDDDHPDADMSRGQRFIWRVYDALTKNKAAWNETLLLITYDEHGGLYDHVIPPIADVFEAGAPTVADPGHDPVVSSDETGTGGTGGRGAVLGHVLGGVLDGGFGGSTPAVGDKPVHVPYGVRVPTFVVSPWVPAGKGPSITLDFCSIIKTVLALFCSDTKPFFSDRVNASLTLDSYLSEPQPREVGLAPKPPEIPVTDPRRTSPTTEIVTEPLFRKRMRAEHVDYHELSGRLARMLGR